MTEKSLFIYDGECPFCNYFAELLEIKSCLPEFEVLDGRKDLALLSQLYKQGYDLDKGAILIKNETIMHGADAINFICSEISEPSDSLLEVLRIIFTSNKRTNILFPILLWSRRLLLTLKGKVWQPVNENCQYY
tara:strand:+ start:327 stop:728 length:402 start_codon:yes stop_codon:yes gene_type:complete